MEQIATTDRPAGPLTLAIDIGGTRLKAGILASTGRMSAGPHRVDTPHPAAATAVVAALVELVGLDPDPTALANAGRKFRRAGLDVRLDRGFAQELPYPDDSFDRVFSSLMLHHLDSESKNALLTEVRRILRPEGRLILADAVVDEGGKGAGHGGMRKHLHDNIADAVNHRIAAAGFTVDPTHRMPLRVGGTVGIEVARPAEG